MPLTRNNRKPDSREPRKKGRNVSSVRLVPSVLPILKNPAFFINTEIPLIRRRSKVELFISYSCKMTDFDVHETRKVKYTTY